MKSVAESKPIVISDLDRQRARRLFERAREVGETGNREYAIELYLEGLGHDPEDLDAHTQLRRLALERKAGGGKPIGSFKAMSLKRAGSDLKQNLINIEKLLAYDPRDTGLMLMMAKAAAKAGIRNAALWIGPILLRANLEGKQDANIFIQLKEIYTDIGEYKLAGDALAYAAASKPEDADLQHELRSLAARMTISQGGYDIAGGDFRKSIRDADKQRALIEQDMDIRDSDAMAGQIARARKEWEESGHDRGKLVRLVDVLTKTEDVKHENEAIDLLEEAFKETESYRYRYSADEIRLRQMSRAERSMRQQLEQDPDDPDLKSAVEELARERLEAELKHYQRAIKAYPTDLRLKYEAGKRLFELGRYDEAIPILQLAQADAKYREEAGVLLGRSFLKADFVDEAVDTLRGRIEAYQIAGDNKSKEMHYWYGRALESKGDVELAVKAYSQIAQWDFGYRDVQRRIKELRGK